MAAQTFITVERSGDLNNVVIPLVQRAAENVRDHSTTSTTDMIVGSAWETLYWNMANWNEVAQ